MSALARRRPMRRGPWRRPKRLYPVDVDLLGMLGARSAGWCEVSSPDCTRKAARVHRRNPQVLTTGERDRLSNLLHVCARCVDWIQLADLLGRARPLGLLLHHSQEPTAAVVWYRTDPVLLDDAGGVHPTETVFPQADPDPDRQAPDPGAH